MDRLQGIIRCIENEEEEYIVDACSEHLRALAQDNEALVKIKMNAYHLHYKMCRANPKTYKLSACPLCDTPFFLTSRLWNADGELYVWKECKFCRYESPSEFSM